MLFDLNKEDLIYPYESSQVNFWARKWGIAPSQLQDAIIQTGSLRRKVLREYLEKKGIVFSFSGFALKMKQRINRIADKFNEEENYA